MITSISADEQIFLNTYSLLDSVEQSAVSAVLQALSNDKSMAEAVEAGNVIFVANGRKAIPYPFPKE